jgi:ABC-type transporter Mla subunit MlaD
MELLITQKRKLGSALDAVAGMLNEISDTADYNQEQLRETLTRFKKQYGAVYLELRDKIWELHQSSSTSRDDWPAFFVGETKSRR